MNIEFTIPGAPVAKGRPRFARRGAFVTTYSPDKTVSYENLVKVMASQAMAGRSPLRGAVSAVIILSILPPASWSQKKKNQALGCLIYPTSKPDVDNVIKGIFDAMNGIIFVDDKQVVSLNVEKCYGKIPCATVLVCSLREAD